MEDLIAPKQLEFILNSNKRWNLAHGSVRSGKTVGSLFAFMKEVSMCPDSQIWMIGHTSSTIYDNAIRLILESPLFDIFKPFCTWYQGKRELHFKDKVISTLGANNAGAIGAIQGKTMSVVYCDEMTLYPDNIIDMIDTRLSNKHSVGFATMNPSYPTHKLKKWIDFAEDPDSQYYALHFTLDDNPFLDEAYKVRIRDSVSGLFYKRNYLGLWCLAEGAVFDFFDRDIYVLKRPPKAAEYWICGIDVGSSNPFAAVLIGVNTGRYDQSKPMFWVEKEYYWDPKKKGRQKTNSEFADDLEEFFGEYTLKGIYMDPAAESMHVEMRRRGFHIMHANNDVLNGIQHMTNLMKNGYLFVCQSCPNVIREIETYVWDPKGTEMGKDQPIKQNDHSLDAIRYALFTHRVAHYDPYAEQQRQKSYMQSRFH